MSVYAVVDYPSRWDLHVPGLTVVSAREYLRSPRLAAERNAKVWNLCRSYAYQSAGYYVSLLAAARGHRALPTLATINDVRDRPLVRLMSRELDELVQKSLSRLTGDRFELSVYFGHNLAKRYEPLSRAIWNQVPAPFLRAEFSNRQRWRLDRVRVIGTEDIPEAHRAFVIEQASRYLRRGITPRPKETPRYELAILLNDAEADPPSDEVGLVRFQEACARHGLGSERIQKDDAARLSEFDALFIRETTRVNHHTYRLARRAAADGLVVIDDPDSILRCTNKVFQAEAFARAGVPHPTTAIVDRPLMADRAALDARMEEVGYPSVVKKPDGSFSQGVYRAESGDDLVRHLEHVLSESELVVVQAWVTSAFDWRVGILAGRPLYACRYFLASGHWKIQVGEGTEARTYGNVETLPVMSIPAQIRDTALRAASLMGDGLYGVDLKEVDGRPVVMEVNDNPSLESDVEDAVLGDALWDALAAEFLRRLERRGRGEGLQ
jgi:glutathione synthase/RimK-type ligase-like ATP-grasp enzyme